jgi:UPF0755 protein
MFEGRRTRRSNKMVRISMLFVLTGVVIMVLLVYKFYGRIYEANVSLDGEQEFFYVPTGSDFEYVIEHLESEGIINDIKSFRWVATRKQYEQNVKPGRYKIRNGSSNNELVNMLRSGNQDPVMVVFNNLKNLNQVAGKVSQYLEGDSLEFAAYLADTALYKEYGFTKETFTSMFIPNTYEFFWTTTPEQFTDRMKREYDDFWKGDRDKKAKRMEMTRADVVTLASIVDEETMHDQENGMVAGVYINRLKRGIPLQADPTLKFAKDDFTVKRILNADKEIESPYNTYKYKGLPPGPISIPSISAIDGVLNHEDHNYVFFCAKADFSGYHAFARSLSEHNKNARDYQKALNNRQIYR